MFILTRWGKTRAIFSLRNILMVPNNGCLEIGSEEDAEITNSKRNIQDKVQLSSVKLGVPCSGIGSVKFV